MQLTDAKQSALQFQLCGQTYAFSITPIVEVAAMVAATPLAGNPSPALHGVIVRRGEPVLLVDLRRVFGCENAPVDRSTLIIVVRYGKELVGLLVDSIQGVIYFQQEVVRSANDADNFLRGVVVVANSVIQWLDITAILANTLPTDELEI